MRYYIQIDAGKVVNRVTFDGEMPAGWADEGAVWREHVSAQIGWGVVNGEPVEPEVLAPVPTADDVRAECQRRVMALTGTTDIIKCLIKQHNAQMRATELVLKKASGVVWTEAETLEAAALQSMADAIKALRVKSNLLEPSPPSDYTDDRHWQ
jgi:hypothetical protein